MSLLDSLGSDVQAVLGQLNAALDQVARRGGVTDIAGNPSAMRSAARVWREAAFDLRYLEGGLTGPARSAGHFWEEPSADAFAGHWYAAAREIESLASDLDRAAQGLDEAAAHLEREAEVLRTVVGDIDNLIAILSGGADPLSLLTAAQRAPVLAAQLEEVLHDIQAVWATVSGCLRGLALTFVHVMGDVANWVGEHGLEISKLAIDAGQIYVGLEMVGGGLGLDAGGLLLDATGVGAIVGVPADVAGTAMVLGGAALTAYGASQTGQDIAKLMSDSRKASGQGGNPPEEITGRTAHGQEQALRRDGHGVSDDAMNDAIKNPVQPIQLQAGGRYRYIGKNATVILNQDGKVVTAWANNRAGWRNP